jgi:hypothetical protein
MCLSYWNYVTTKHCIESKMLYVTLVILILIAANRNIWTIHAFDPIIAVYNRWYTRWIIPWPDGQYDTSTHVGLWLHIASGRCTIILQTLWYCQACRLSHIPRVLRLLDHGSTALKLLQVYYRPAWQSCWSAFITLLYTERCRRRHSLPAELQIVLD